MKKISVIIPSYNHAKYVGSCLDAIFFQDHPDLEMIIVDDHSTDGTVEAVQDWLRGVGMDETSFASTYNERTGVIERTVHKRYNRPGRTILFETSGENLGSTRNYNRGFRLATGDYCTFVASDDIPHPQMLSTLAEPLDRDLADFAYGDMFVVDDNQRILREFRLPDYSFEASFCHWYLCGVATLYRRSLHERFGYYLEEAGADDHECYLRFAMNGARFVHVPKTLYSVRSHDQRRVGLHADDRFQTLLDHSGQLTLKARRWAHGNRQ